MTYDWYDESWIFQAFKIKKYWILLDDWEKIEKIAKQTLKRHNQLLFCLIFDAKYKK